MAEMKVLRASSVSEEAVWRDKIDQDFSLLDHVISACDKRGLKLDHVRTDNNGRIVETNFSTGSH